MRRIQSIFFLLVIVTMTAPVAHASLSTPTGLSLGDQFHWAFVTGVIHNAESTDIGDYNAYVTEDAKNGVLTAEVAGDWKVIGSTASVNASENVGNITHPIYNLADELVAANGADLFDGNNLTNPIDRAENDLVVRGWWVLTGTLSDGTAAPGYVDDPPETPIDHTGALGDLFPVFGETYTFGWLDITGGTAHYEISSYGGRLYAISGIQTVVPLPAALWLLGSGLIGIVGIRRKFRS